MMPWIVVAAVGCTGIVAASEFVRLRRADRRFRRALAAWRESAPDDRQRALSALAFSHERSGAAWYLLGVVLLRRGEAADAARYFGMAHHADCDLPSAALLTFSCMKTAAAGTDWATVFHRQLATTWAEMRRPPLDATPSERALLAAFDAGDPPVGLSPPGRVAWCIGGAELRLAFDAITAERPAWAAELFAAADSAYLPAPDSSGNPAAFHPSSPPS